MQHIMWGEIGLSTLPGSYKDTSVTGCTLVRFSAQIGRATDFVTGFSSVQRCSAFSPITRPADSFKYCMVGQLTIRDVSAAVHNRASSRQPRQWLKGLGSFCAGWTPSDSRFQ